MEEIKNYVYDIIVLAGQSNAEGNGFGSDDYNFLDSDKIDFLKGEFSYSVKNDEFGNKYLDLKLSEDYYIEQAKYRIDDNGNEVGNFILPFANEYRKKHLQNGRKVLIVQTAIGGTGFSKNHWGKGDVLFDRMLKMVRYALSLNGKNRLVAFLWHQGEHDTVENAQLNFEQRKEFYYQKLNETLTTFRKEFGNVPFVCAGFTRLWFEKHIEQCKAVYEAIEKVVRENKKTAFVSNTHDLKSNAEQVGNDDQAHFSKEALSILGLRYYKNWSKLK